MTLILAQLCGKPKFTSLVIFAITLFFSDLSLTSPAHLDFVAVEPHPETNGHRNIDTKRNILDLDDFILGKIFNFLPYEYGSVALVSLKICVVKNP